MEVMAYAASSLERARKFYRIDLEALSDDQLMLKGMPKGRRPVDFTYEVATVNQRFAKRLRGETVDPPSGDDWTVAPDEYCDRTKLTEFLEASFDEVLAAIRSIPESEAERLVQGPMGEMPIYQFAMFPSFHASYHDAQLNFIQTLSGDMEWHWMKLSS